MGRLHGMILVNLVETFERYLKEAAAACVDALARYVLDDRFNAFKVQGSASSPRTSTPTRWGDRSASRRRGWTATR